MEEKTARVRIKTGQGEIEIEGTEAFVREFVDTFDGLLESLKMRPEPAPIPDGQSLEDKVPVGQRADVPEVFGEYYQRFPSSISDIDRMLVASYFVQCHDSESSFKTRAANQLLKGQGVKVANASECVRNSIRAKRVFALPQGKYRVSQAGVDYIKQLPAS